MAARRGRPPKNRDGIRKGAKPRVESSVESIACRRPKCKHHHPAHWIYYTDAERNRWNARCQRWMTAHPEVMDDGEEFDDLEEFAGGADELREGA